MSDYFDVLAFKKTKSDKTYAVKLGTAKRRDDGGFQLYLDAMPAPENGQFQMTVAPRREQGVSNSSRAQRDFNAPLDDTIPF